ncbi:hypothetical protein CKO44_25760, partial [Rubrivivax gelatinosus]|nr:hypothetical protein [Rubrivivax gelatinosus]
TVRSENGGLPTTRSNRAGSSVRAKSPVTIRARGIALLPQSLGEAVAALEADPVLLDALGPSLGPEFLRLKRAEWTEYARHVGAWELERYAAAF